MAFELWGEAEFLFPLADGAGLDAGDGFVWPRRWPADPVLVKAGSYVTEEAREFTGLNARLNAIAWVAQQAQPPIEGESTEAGG